MRISFVRLAAVVSWCATVAACDSESDPTGLGRGDPLPSSSHLEDDFRGDWRVRSLALGVATACAIGQPDGRVACWGRNDHGQLGNGSRSSSSIPVSLGSLLWRSIDVGDTHVCGVQADGAAYCWGANDLGQLGDGTTTERLSPVPVAGGRTTFVQVRVGITHSCALDAAGATFCWGDNDHGQLGNGEVGGFESEPILVQGGLDFDDLFPANDRTCALDAGGQAYCWGAYRATGADLSSPTPAPGSLTFTHLSVTSFDTCGLTEAFELYCWGGEGNVNPAPTSLGTEYYLLSPTAPCAVNFRTEEAGTDCWDAAYEPVTIFAGVGWRSGFSGGFRMQGDQIAGGTLCATNANLELFCWGEGGEGQIGDGFENDRAQPTPVLLPNDLPSVTDLRVTVVSETSVTLTWTEVYVSGGQPARYRMKTAPTFFDLQADWGDQAIVCNRTIVGAQPGAIISCTAEGLQPGAMHFFRLASYGLQNGAWADVRFSNVVGTRTVGTQVMDLALFGPTANSLTVRWTQVDDGTGAPAWYRVKYGSPLGSWKEGTIGCERSIQGTAIGQTLSCTIVGLDENTEYDVQLASYRLEDGAWTNVRYSNVATRRTAVIGGGVDDLIASAVGTRVTATWTQIDDGTGSPARYRLKYGSPLGDWSDATVGCNVTGRTIGSPLSCEITGLAPNTDYELQLMSYRLVEGAWAGALFSNIAEVRTEE